MHDQSIGRLLTELEDALEQISQSLPPDESYTSQGGLGDRVIVEVIRHPQQPTNKE